MDTYLVAVKRQHRHRVTDDWATVLESIEGVEPTPETLRSNRLQIKATPSGIAKVKESLGDLCHVEAVIPHRLPDPIAAREATTVASATASPKPPTLPTDDEVS